jgi:hypothetical protein
MTEKKMTKREYFTRILSYAHDEDKEFIEHEIALLDKKNSAERKPTAKQVENEGFKSDIVAWMESDKLYAIADIAKGVPSLDAAGVQPQRVTALMTQLKEAGKVVRTEVKGKAFYSLA